MSTSSRLCIFSRHRDKIKFEDFNTNHPATYVPFVCYNFLIMSILPSLFDKESKHMEISRLFLLQEQALTLKIIQTLVNTVLNLNLKLSDNTFQNNIEILKTSNNKLTLDVVFPLLLVENYVSYSDAEKYKSSLSSLLKTELINNSSDLIPCPTFYQDMGDKLIGPQIWGPSYWSVTHYAAFVTDKLGSEEHGNNMAALSGVFDLLLPCNICRYDYRSLHEPFISSVIDTKFHRPYPLTLPFLALEYFNKRKLFEFYSILHEHCKDPTDLKSKEPLSVDFYKNINSQFWTKTNNNKIRLSDK